MTVTTDLFRNESDPHAYQPGEDIFKQGSPGDAMYAVIEGSVNILRDGVVVDTIGPGGIFGEMALIDDHPRSATATVNSACKVARIDEKRFNFLVRQTPFFALHVMRVLTERLRKQTEA